MIIHMVKHNLYLHENRRNCNVKNDAQVGVNYISRVLFLCFVH